MSKTDERGNEENYKFRGSITIAVYPVRVSLGRSDDGSQKYT
jgi:hypothetical protein